MDESIPIFNLLDPHKLVSGKCVQRHIPRIHSIKNQATIGVIKQLVMDLYSHKCWILEMTGTKSSSTINEMLNNIRTWKQSKNEQRH
jgi:hypothetical protein